MAREDQEDWPWFCIWSFRCSFIQLNRNNQSVRPRTPFDTAAGARELYALTSICYMRYIKEVESVFEIIAEPNRRAILSLLVSSEQSVGEIERQLRMPQPTV